MTENSIFFQCLNIQETLILLNRSRIQELSTETYKEKKATASSHKEKALAFFLWAWWGEWETSPLCTNHSQEHFNRILIICVGVVKWPRHIVHVKTWPHFWEIFKLTLNFLLHFITMYCSAAELCDVFSRVHCFTNTISHPNPNTLIHSVMNRTQQ